LPAAGCNGGVRTINCQIIKIIKWRHFGHLVDIKTVGNLDVGIVGIMTPIPQSLFCTRTIYWICSISSSLHARFIALVLARVLYTRDLLNWFQLKFFTRVIYRIGSS
jgi:hypothetical protein